MTTQVATTVATVGRARRTPGAGRASVALIAALLAVALIAALIGPWLAPHHVGAVVAAPFGGGDPVGPLGADRLGRDVWSQVLHGGRSVVVLPLLATAIGTAVGGTLGLVVAARRRPGITVLLRLADIVLVLPPVLVVLVLVHRFGEGRWVLALAAVAVSSPFVAHLARAVAEPVLASGYVEQAVLRGERRVAILWREVLPNVVGPLLADAGLRFVATVYLIAAASFLGFGPEQPATDWASMIGENIDGAGLNAWTVVAPSIAIATLTVPANLLADRLSAWIAR